MNTRYDFGRNWADYSKQLNKESIDNACEGLSKLLDNVQGLSFMDIGSGSGVHSLAASLLGADEIFSVDYDIDSVETTKEILNENALNQNWQVSQGDILSDTLLTDKTYDLVYSWGVLHHTGNVWKAIENTLQYVRKDGLLVIALYLETPFCQLWKFEKYVYSHYKYLRPFIKYPYIFLLMMNLCLRNMKSPSSILKNYNNVRGMSFIHDVDDWLGGYPYESVNSAQLIQFMEERKFKLVKEFNTKPSFGLFGTGCGEWVFQQL